MVKANPRAAEGEVRVQAPEIGLDASLDTLPADHPIAAALAAVLAELEILRAPACTIRVTSTIPIAAGLGSGAAVSVALIRAFAGFLGTDLPDERVSALAFEVEKLYHGTPSGIDNTVIAYAQPVLYRREVPIERFSIVHPFSFLIADTGVPSPTAATVGDVRRGWQADQVRYERVFNEIGAITNLAVGAITAGDRQALGRLMDANQAWLEKLGVSSPELEALIQVARQAGAWGAKLSGGGRGGNMIALVDDEASDRIVQSLLAAGATATYRTAVGGPDG
jgi:mevalonate kinase